ncbi:MAG: acid phosphatase [Legionellales bacterium]|nr:acid phosphatase [Legionellales bacterium]
MNKKFFYNLVFLACGILLLHTQSWAEPANLGLLKESLVQYHDSGKYLKEIQNVTTQAITYIDQVTQSNAQLPQPKKLAIVLDIDETSLSNFANMKQSDFANNPDTIKAQLLAADEPPIQPVLDLYMNALKKNIAVFFITGRDQTLAEATAQNLHAAGYQSWSGLEFRPDNTPSSTYKTAARAKIAQQGYSIIASIGDQESDLIGGFSLRTFKLPNPYYYIP